jgi:hypothetical protein
MDFKQQSKLTSAINSIRCREHGTRPQIRFSGSEVKVTNICCEKFERQVGEAATKGMNEYVNETLKSSFKKSGFKIK